MTQSYKGAVIYYTLFPRRDTQWSRDVHPRGVYHRLTSGPMADSSVFTFVQAATDVATMVAGGARVEPTLPRRIYNAMTGTQPPHLKAA